MDSAIQRIQRLSNQISQLVESGRRAGLSDKILEEFFQDALKKSTDAPASPPTLMIQEASARRWEPRSASVAPAAATPPPAAKPAKATPTPVASKSPAASKPAAAAAAVAPAAAAKPAAAQKPESVFAAAANLEDSPVAAGGAGSAPTRTIEEIVLAAGNKAAAAAATMSAPPMSPDWGDMKEDSVDWKIHAKNIFEAPFKTISKSALKENSLLMETTDISVMHDAVINARSKHFNTEGLSTFINNMKETDFTAWLKDVSIRKDEFTIYGLLKDYVPLFFGENMANSSIKYMKFTAAYIIKPHKNHHEKDQTTLHNYFGVEGGMEPTNVILRNVAMIQAMQNALMEMICKIVSKYSGIKSIARSSNSICMEFKSADALAHFSEEINYIQREHGRLRYPSA
jgi:hypothetical protein